jgi:hypothetical protein
MLAWLAATAYSRCVPGQGPAGVLFDLPGLTQRDYHALTEALEIDTAPPDGAVLYLAGPHPEGGWLIVTVWLSVEAFQRFATERLLPAARALGIAPVRPRIFPVSDLLARRAECEGDQPAGDLHDAVVALTRRHTPSA